VDTVIVNGRIVVEGGAVVGLDVPVLVERVEAISQALLRSASRASGRDYFQKG
jgi:hypothetical protein